MKKKEQKEREQSNGHPVENRGTETEKRMRREENRRRGTEEKSKPRGIPPAENPKKLR